MSQTPKKEEEATRQQRNLLSYKFLLSTRLKRISMKQLKKMQRKKIKKLLRKKLKTKQR